jgi:DNA-binding transcriptional regulator YiaG
MTIKELRQRAGMSQQAFGDYFSIPVRTIQNWEAGINQCAGYLIALMEYKLKTEGIIQ